MRAGCDEQRLANSNREETCTADEEDSTDVERLDSQIQQSVLPLLSTAVLLVVAAGALEELVDLDATGALAPSALICLSALTLRRTSANSKRKEGRTSLFT